VSDYQHDPDQIYPFASIAPNVGVFLLAYDPYHPEKLRKEIALFDATRLVDAPQAQVVVLIPAMKQHVESGSRVDLDVLRHGVDVVGVYDADSARRVGKALAGSGVRVIVMPPPKMREIQHPEEYVGRKAIPGRAAALQMMFNITNAEARDIANELGDTIPEQEQRLPRRED
jgi:hypothetical protein